MASAMTGTKRPRIDDEAKAFLRVIYWCQNVWRVEDVKEFERRALKWHPILVATALGTVDDVRAIIEHGKKCARLFTDDESALNGFADRLAKGSDFENDDAFRANCVSPLSIAASRGKTDVVEYLLSQGADVSGRYTRDLQKRPKFSNLPALHFAAIYNHLDTVNCLLDAGAEIHACDDDRGGDTAVMHAVEKGHAEIVRCLMGRGAGDHPRRPLVVLAALNGHVELVRYLLDLHRRDTETVNATFAPTNATSLHYAAAKGNLELAELLLSRGAAVEIKDCWGFTALDNARVAPEGTDQSSMIDLLVAHGAQMDPEWKYEMKPIKFEFEHFLSTLVKKP